MAPPEIEGSTANLVARTPAAITRTTPIRSSHGARLNNSHHTITSTPPRTPASNATGRSASGITIGRTTNSDAQHAAMIANGQVRSLIMIPSLRSKGLKHVDVRRSRGGHQRRRQCRAGKNAGSAEDWSDSGQLQLIDVTSSQGGKYIATCSAGCDAQ